MSFCASSLAEHPATKPLAKLDHPLGRRLTVLSYGVLCYIIFFFTFLYAFAWLANLAPRSIDGPAHAPFLNALLTNVGLLLLFAVQHSVMARPWFKARWTRIVPEPAERSTYVLFSSLALIALFAFWQPMGGIIWSIEHPSLKAALLAIMVAGWLLVLASTFFINHFDLFGLRQVWLYARNRPYTHLPFKTPWLYRFVRHPLYVGWFIGFWATPTMTLAHLVFALMTSVYILAAIRWEERDLVEMHGRNYVDYRRNVPMLIPRLTSRTN